MLMASRNIAGNMFQATDKVPGGLAGALRSFAKNLQPIGGSDHLVKGAETITALQKWLVRNPNASLSDISTAQTLLRDLRQAQAQAMQAAQKAGYPIPKQAYSVPQK